MQLGDSSVLQTLLRLVHTSQQQQVPLQRAAESFALYFIPAVLCFTVATVTFWIIKVFSASNSNPLSPLQQLRYLVRQLDEQHGISGEEQQQLIFQQQQLKQQQLGAHSGFLAASIAPRFDGLSSFPEAAVASPAAAAAACKLSNWAVAWDSILFALRFGVAVCCAACPCAVGLAAPAALAAATAAAATRGIFFKSGRALETAAKANILVIDKTGTLTTGELRVRLVAYEGVKQYKYAEARPVMCPRTTTQ